MVLAISGGDGFFSQLQYELSHTKNKRVRVTAAVRDHLNDLYQLAQDLGSRPTRIAELFPADPGHIFGTCDASGLGMGGTFFTEDGSAFAWRVPFPSSVTEQLVSFDNPKGQISNSDLELAATIVQDNVIGANEDIQERTVRTFSDNIAAVSWRNKGSATTTGPAAYLLREAALQQRRLRHVPRAHYLPGPQNGLADAMSRRFDLTDEQLISLLNSLAPQKHSWQLLPCQPNMISTVMQALHKRRPVNQSITTAPRLNQQSGTASGSLSSPRSKSTIPCSAASRTKSPFYASVPPESEMVGSVAVDSPSAASMLLTRSTKSQQRSPVVGPKTPVKMRLDKSIQDSHACTEPGKTRTPPPAESSHAPSSCSTKHKPSSPWPKTPHRSTWQQWTWPGLPSSFSSASTNGPRHATTPHSDCAISTLSAMAPCWTDKIAQPRTSFQQPTSPSLSKPKRTESVGRPSPTPHGHAPSAQWHDASRIYANLAPPVTPFCVPSTNMVPRFPCKERTSPPSSAGPSPRCRT